MSPDRAMPVLVYRNPCCAQDSHPRCQYAGGTNVKLIGVGAEGCAAVGAVQQVGSTMIDEFLYLEPVSPAASTTLLSARSTSLAEAVQGADFAVMIARRETVEDAVRVIESHMQSDHPELVGEVSFEDLLAMAEEA